MQIGYLSLSDGQVRPISRDTNSYSTLTLSADGKTLATVQQKTVSNLFILPGEGSASPTASPLGCGGRDDRQLSAGRPTVIC
jgi:Tol biopolymer transport system component